MCRKTHVTPPDWIAGRVGKSGLLGLTGGVGHVQGGIWGVCCGWVISDAVCCVIGDGVKFSLGTTWLKAKELSQIKEPVQSRQIRIPLVTSI